MSTPENRDEYRTTVPPRTDAELARERDLSRDPAAATYRDGDTAVYPGQTGVARDRDGDGVADYRERDGVVAGSAAGSRDQDGDGVADYREAPLHEVVADRERERFGGIKFGSAFFGWLTALGALVVLTAVVAAIGAAIGLSSPATVDDAAEAASENLGTATIIGAIAIAVVLFVAYFAGGYVAGRMARFSGAKQGFAVWLWAVVIAILVAVITAIAGSQWDILTNVDIFPRIPVTADTATLTGILTAVGAAAITLIAAVLGGMSGMRYHRRVDRVGLGAARY